MAYQTVMYVATVRLENDVPAVLQKSGIWGANVATGKRFITPEQARSAAEESLGKLFDAEGFHALKVARQWALVL